MSVTLVNPAPHLAPTFNLNHTRSESSYRTQCVRELLLEMMGHV
jgi:hypothetical protein